MKERLEKLIEEAEAFADYVEGKLSVCRENPHLERVREAIEEAKTE